MCYNAATMLLQTSKLASSSNNGLWSLDKGEDEISPTQYNTRASNCLRSPCPSWGSTWLNMTNNKPQINICFWNFWVLHVNHFQSAIRQMPHGLGQALHSSRRAMASHWGCADVPRTTQWSQQVTLVHRRDSSRQSVDPWWTIGVCRSLQMQNMSKWFQMCPMSKSKSNSELQAMLEFHQHLCKWSFTGITTQLHMTTCTLKRLTCGRSR